MNYICLALLSCLTIQSMLFCIPIKDPILKRIDGIPKVMDADNINNAIIAGRMLLIFMKGGNLKSIPLEEIEYKGKSYTLDELLSIHYEGKKHTLKDLVKFEGKKNDAEIAKALKEARKKFNIFMSPMMAQARGAKQMMKELIDLSCANRGRNDSILKNWAQVKEGQEQESLKQSVTSFKIFNIFCNDLINFLKDLVDSCPKALAQLQARQKHNLSKR